MPTPRQQARAREFFGYGPMEAYDVFKPALDPEDRRYTPAARDQFFMAEAQGRDRNAVRGQWAAEDEAAMADQAARQMLQDSRGQSASGLLKLMADTPEVMQSRLFPMISQAQRMKEEAEKPNPFSDQVLGPQFASRIQNPVLRTQFEDDMVQGVNANAAWRNHLNREFNYDKELKLAQAGVPETEWEKFRGPDGLYKESAIMGALRTPKPDMALRDIETRLKVVEGMRDDLGDLPPAMVPVQAALMKEYQRMLQTAYPGQQPVAATETAVAAPPAAQPPPPPQPTPPIGRMTPEERAAAKPKAEEAAKINAEWTKAKDNLKTLIAKAYPDPEEQLGILDAVINNKPSPLAIPRNPQEAAEFAKSGGESYAAYLLRKLGIKPTDEAFKEPGNARRGSQRVNFREVLDALAKDVVAPEQAAVQQELSPAAKAIIEKINKGV